MEYLTLTRLRALLAEEGIAARKSLGQNFLVDRNVRDKIVRFAELSRGDTVVEIGPGLGALTEALVEQAGTVHAWEPDARLCAILRRRFAGVPNLRLVEGDFLASGPGWWRSLPEPVTVIGNTPYCRSAAMALHILQVPRPLRSAVLTVQREVGERFAAGPGSKDYCGISVLLALYTRTRICYSLNKDVFYPRPDVQSVVVKIVPTAGSGVPPEDRAALAEFLPQVFRYRRKKLSNAVGRVFRIPRDLFERECAEAGIPAGVRIEELAPEAIVRLWSAMRRLTPGMTTPPLEG